MSRCENIVCGNFNQGCPLIFGYSAGKQCSSVYVLHWLHCVGQNVRNVKISKELDLDFISCKGNKVYKGIAVDRMLDIDELPSQILILKTVSLIFITSKSGLD